MEVGAVKQAFNNELIQLKKKLNQAKIQIIHKLTRKAKTLAEKKAPENIKEKLKRKATAAVNEVLIMKKIKPKDLAKFIITHKGDLNSYLNKPTVDQDKVCARLLLHKSLQDKYKFIRERFSSVPIDDLLMSREERKKLKKEAKEKQKNKKKGKQAKVVNAEGEWDVEDVAMPVNLNNTNSGTDLSDNDEDLAEKLSSNEDGPNEDDGSNEDDKSNKDNSSDNETSGQDDQELDDSNAIRSDDESEDSKESEPDEDIPSEIGKFVKANSVSPQKVKLVTPKKAMDIKTILDVKPKLSMKPDKKTKDKNKQEKNKNLNEKLLTRKFKKDVVESPVPETKVVDSFFITSTGENYMSVVEPRPPDEVKDVHKQGNRKLRRAAMFGHVPKIKPRKYNDAPDNRFKKQNGFNSNSNSNRFNDNNSFSKFNENNSDKRKFTDKRSLYNRNEDSKPVESNPEKLHPSWEAKKRQSGIQPFQGKKIVFDES